MTAPPPLSHADSEITRSAADAFASAFDANDYGAFASMLTEDCELIAPGHAVRGATRVAEVFRAAAAWAERAFDECRHESVVARFDGEQAELEITSYLMRVPGRWYRFRRTRRLTVERDGRIASITDVADDATRAEFGAPPAPLAFGAGG